MKTCRTKRKVKTQIGLISFITVFACFIGLANGSHAEDLSAFSDKFICNMATIKIGEKYPGILTPLRGYLLEASRRKLNACEDREENSKTYLLPALNVRRSMNANNTESIKRIGSL